MFKLNNSLANCNFTFLIEIYLEYPIFVDIIDLLKVRTIHSI